MSAAYQDLFDPMPEADVTARKHGGNPESRAAFAKIEPTLSDQRERVYDAILKSRGEGLTCKELARTMGVGMNAISGRFTELKQTIRIMQRHDQEEPVRRNGCAVFLARGRLGRP